MENQKSKKMDKGNLLRCLATAHHHVDGDSKIELIFGTIDSRQEIKDVLKYRFRIQREEIAEVISRIQRIEEIAKKQNNQEVLAVLNEEFEFGHDMQ